MQPEKRECGIDFHVDFLSRRWQHFDFTINGETYQFTCSAAVSEMLGDFIDVLYELYIESDEAGETKVKYTHDDPLSGHITGIDADFEWDYEGEVLNWKISRRLYEPEIMLDITLDYEYGEKISHCRVPYFDLCYAVAKATTELLKKTGIIGYHYLGEFDNYIDIHHFLYIKHLGIFGRPFPYLQYPDEDSYIDNPEDYKTSFEDEIRLLTFEM